MTLKDNQHHGEAIPRRSVLIGAAAIGGAMVVSNAFSGTYTQTANAAPIPAQQNSTTAHQTIAITKESSEAPTPTMLKGWKIQPFALDEVNLNGGVFDRAKQGLLEFAKNYPVDRMLTCFRAQAGLDTKGAAPAGGWENFPKNSLDLAQKQQWGPKEYKRGQNKDTADGLLRGHYAGHYMSCLAQAYAESKDATILENINTMVTGLVECRAALRKMTAPDGTARYSHPGFLAAYGEWQFSALEEYAPYGEIWAPWYTEHKILAGLLAIYECTGNADALDLAEGIGHWTYSRLSKCTSKQLQKMWDIYIGGEFGGMNDALIDLYNLTKQTGDDKEEFLKAAHYFDTDKLIINCANGVDILNDLHANQHLPQFVGYAKDAAMGENKTGSGEDADFLKTTEGFWKMIVPGRMYAHGGTGEGEMWGPAHTVAGDIGSRNAESCAAYNMLKIARYLFFIDPKPEYMDYYERTVLNHILGGKSRSLDSGKDLTPGNCYMFPVDPGATKEYGNGNIGTCCGGTALESHTKYQDSVYFHSSDNSELYVNLFMPTTLNWSATGFKLTQTTNYPEEGTSTITIDEATGAELSIKIRIPSWSSNVELKVNGQSAGVKAESGTYATIKRSWKAGDTIEINIPLTLRTESTDDRQDIQSLFYGPTVLVALKNSKKYVARGFANRLGLDGAIKLGVQVKPGEKNYFIIDGDEFEPAYNGDNTPYHMYFQRKDDYVGFAGKTTDVSNAKKPASGDQGASTLMDDIWSAAPFADRKAFLAQVTKVTAEYQKAGLLTSRNRQSILLAAGRAKMS